MACAEDAVRVLTIHGAKGLEAEIVVLADAHAAPPNDGAGVLASWSPRKRGAGAPVAACGWRGCTRRGARGLVRGRRRTACTGRLEPALRRGDASAAGAHRLWQPLGTGTHDQLVHTHAGGGDIFRRRRSRRGGRTHRPTGGACATSCPSHCRPAGAPRQWSTPMRCDSDAPGMPCWNTARMRRLKRSRVPTG